jgi:hypothetical protein
MPCTGCNDNSVVSFSPVSVCVSAASCRAKASAANAAKAASCSAAAAMTVSTSVCVEATRFIVVWLVPSSCSWGTDMVKLLFTGTRVCLGVGATTAVTADAVGVGATVLMALDRLALLLTRTKAVAAAAAGIDTDPDAALLLLIAVGLMATVLGSGGKTDGAVVSMINDLPGDDRDGCAVLPCEAGDQGLGRMDAAVVVVGDVGGDGLRLCLPAVGDEARRAAWGAPVGANPRLTASNADVDTFSSGGNTNAKSLRSTVGMGTP